MLGTYPRASLLSPKHTSDQHAQLSCEWIFHTKPIGCNIQETMKLPCPNKLVVSEMDIATGRLVVSHERCTGCALRVFLSVRKGFDGITSRGAEAYLC